MKKILPAIAFGLLILSTSVAQSEVPEATTYPTPKWVSEKGFWVVETNTHTPGRNIVYFYTNEKVLVYKENVEGIVIKLKKRRVKMNLKKVLEQSITTYNQKHFVEENQMLVMNLIGKH